MRRFLLRRIGQAIGTIFGVVTLIFFLQRLTGDPTYLLVPETATQADIDALRTALGFDRPLVVQYLDVPETARPLRSRVAPWCSTCRSATIIASRLPYTLQLAGGALLVACGIGMPVGILLAVYRDTPARTVARERRSGGAEHADLLERHPADPALRRDARLAAAVVDRRHRASDHAVDRARAAEHGDLRAHHPHRAARRTLQGLRPHGPLPRRAARDGCFCRHLARNASIPVITVAALEISNLLAGAVIVETVFAWPGLGQVTVQSILARDFLVVQGIVLLGAFVTMALNLAADLLYSVVDPRIRLDGSAPMTSATASAPLRPRPAGRAVSICDGCPSASSRFFVFAAVFAPLVAPYDPNSQNLLGRLKPPGTVSRSFHYLLGSDELGRDLLSRDRSTARGSRSSSPLPRSSCPAWSALCSA